MMTVFATQTETRVSTTLVTFETIPIATAAKQIIVD